MVALNLLFQQKRKQMLYMTKFISLITYI